MKRLLLLPLLFSGFLTSDLFAYESFRRCYQLMRTANSSSRTPELMCIDEYAPTAGSTSAPKGQIELLTGMNHAVVGKLHFDLLSRVKFIKAGNRDQWGLSNPSNSVFNRLKVKFFGTVDPASEEDSEPREHGTVTIGQNSFFYAETASPALSAAAPSLAVTHERCFKLSAAASMISRTPELLCVGQLATDQETYRLNLLTGMDRERVGVLYLNLTHRVRCIDCNKDVFSLSNPENSIFNNLTVAFDGKREALVGGRVRYGLEKGKVKIGKTTFFYQETEVVAPAEERDL